MLSVRDAARRLGQEIAAGRGDYSLSVFQWEHGNQLIDSIHLRDGCETVELYSQPQVKQGNETMIRLEITNPHEHSAAELLPLIGYLSSVAGHPVATSVHVRSVGEVSKVDATVALSPAAAQVFAAGAPAIPSAPAASDTDSDENESSANTSDVSGVLDSAGQPWDARIHSGGKSLIADGTWRIKKGTDPKLVEQVRAEHSGKSAASATAAAGSTATAPSENAQTAPTSSPAAASNTAPPIPATPASPALAADPAPTALASGATIQTVFTYISGKGLQPDQIGAALGDIMGIRQPSDILKLKDDPAQLGTALELLKAAHGA